MRVLIVTNSRADWNAMRTLVEGFEGRGHEVAVWNTHYESTRKIASFDLNAAAARTWWPDLVFVGGDRRETLMCALLCADRGVPIAHLAGGDQTSGSADDRFRDAITALACAHFATNALAYNRLAGMKRVGDLLLLSGSPAIDCIEAWKAARRAPPMRPQPGPVVIAVHPNTSGQGPALLECEAIITAIDLDLWRPEHASRWMPPDLRFVALAANADPGGAEVNQALAALSRRDSRVNVCSDLSAEDYYALLDSAALMLGNSSAGYYEAPSFNLPVVDVGHRQFGRMRPANVLNVPADPVQIAAAVKARLEDKLPRLDILNPYGDGKATLRIISYLEANEDRFLRKHDRAESC